MFPWWMQWIGALILKHSLRSISFSCILTVKILACSKTKPVLDYKLVLKTIEKQFPHLPVLSGTLNRQRVADSTWQMISESIRHVQYKGAAALCSRSPAFEAKLGHVPPGRCRTVIQSGGAAEDRLSQLISKEERERVLTRGGEKGVESKWL